VRPDLIILISTVFAASACAGDQPQWGQRWTRNLVSDERNLPESFDPATGRNVAWSAELGTEAHASPVIGRGRVLIGTNNNHPRDPRHQGDRGVLMCFDEKDGRFRWQLVVPKIPGDKYLDWPNAGLSSTSTIAGDRVYTLTNRGEVLCLDLDGMANGNDGPFRDEAVHQTPAGEPPIEAGPTDADILWRFDLRGEPTGVYPNDAFHTSPLLHGRHLYLNTSNGVDNTHRKIRAPDAPSLVVFDTVTGRLLARDQEGIGPRIFHCTWSPPALAEVGGRPLVFLGGGDGIVYAFAALAPDAPTDRVHALRCVWTYDADPGSPKENVHRYHTNRREGPSNIYGMPVFADGRLFVAGGGDLWWGKNEAWLVCLDPAATEPSPTPDAPRRARAMWTYRFGRHTMATPVVHGGLVYATDTDGRLHCLDAVTGAVRWIHQAKGAFWASPLVADGKIYVGTRSGQFLVLATGSDLRVLATVELRSPVSATAVAANGTLFVTTMDRLYAVRK
jgi:outer membrane protein assembly factor BamB